MSRDLSTLLRRKARSGELDEHAACSGCHRIPLAGETMHELESHRVVCQLCLVRIPERKRATLRSERVHVSERPLARVLPRAA